MRKKIALLSLCFLLATFGVAINAGFAAVSDIQITLAAPISNGDMTFNVDVDGSSATSYDVDLNGGGEVHYYQAGDTVSVGVESFVDDQIDVYMLMIFSGDEEGEFWLERSVRLEGSTSTVSIQFHDLSNATTKREKLATLANKETMSVLDLFISDNVLDYPVTFWAMSANPTTGLVTGMDAKTVLINPDLTQTFLKEGGALTVDFGAGNQLEESEWIFDISEQVMAVVTVKNVQGTYKISGINYYNKAGNLVFGPPAQFGSASNQLNAMSGGQDSDGNYLINVYAGADYTEASHSSGLVIRLIDSDEDFTGGTNGTNKIIDIRINTVTDND